MFFRITDQRFEKVPYFVFGDFNFRLDTRQVVEVSTDACIASISVTESTMVCVCVYEHSLPGFTGDTKHKPLTVMAHYHPSTVAGPAVFANQPSKCIVRFPSLSLPHSLPPLLLVQMRLHCRVSVE